jgi:hypothetical protein
MKILILEYELIQHLWWPQKQKEVRINGAPPARECRDPILAFLTNGLLISISMRPGMGHLLPEWAEWSQERSFNVDPMLSFLRTPSIGLGSVLWVTKRSHLSLPTYASYVARIIAVYHNAQLVCWDLASLNFWHSRLWFPPPKQLGLQTCVTMPTTQGILFFKKQNKAE